MITDSDSLVEPEITPVRQPDMFDRMKAALRSPLTWLLLLVLYVLYSRLWNLAGKVMHHDESLFAYYGYWLYRGNGYDYQPILHGPVLQFVSAFFFLLFGDDQWTMRLPSLVGGLLMFPVAWCWRRYIGGVAGAVAVTGLIAFSPSIAYYTRFLRNDVPYLTATMWTGYCMVRALQTASPRYVWGGIMGATLMFCMMESSIFFFAACIGYLVTMGLVDLLVWKESPDGFAEADSFLISNDSRTRPAGSYQEIKDSFLIFLLALLMMILIAAAWGLLTYILQKIWLWISGHPIVAGTASYKVVSGVTIVAVNGLLYAIMSRFKNRHFSAKWPSLIPLSASILLISAGATAVIAWLFHRVL